MRILVVEDDVFLATDLAEQLQDHGFEVVGPCLNNSDALTALEAHPCDAAVLDINLGSETSEPVARSLLAGQIPFVVVSGYLGSQTPSVFDGAVALSKPVQVEKLVNALRV